MNPVRRAEMIADCLARAEAELERAVILFERPSRSTLTEQQTRWWMVFGMDRHHVVGAWLKTRRSLKRAVKFCLNEQERARTKQPLAKGVSEC